ncbi:hypothetical protein HO173_003328 [Letharia columbiana]|uniref:Uncharacterized protein n=1 Tax=Letharia columbiana TaxID=112416 RepID=A0A8H6G1M1_9LECA|nr:uncharacterized protein HO173_003328 [Letharia columbiana]KAF6238821.1 hypothetical protein HO173_003328 [Letharia columbiana]
MPIELIPCHVEAVIDAHEAGGIVHNVFQHLENTLPSGSQQRRTRSQICDSAFIVDFLSEQLLYAPSKVFAATAWLQAKVRHITTLLRTTPSVNLQLVIKGLDISSVCPDSTLQAINDSNKRLIASAKEAKKAYKTEDRKRNHLDRIEKSLQRPLADVFNCWTPEGPSDHSQLAVGTLAAIERAVALSPHLTPDEVSIALNTAVNGPGITTDQLGEKPSQTLILALCHQLQTTSTRTPIDSNAREVNPRLQRFLRQKRQTSSSP